MSDVTIPDDLRRAAREALGEPDVRVPMVIYGATVDRVALALLDERERCAKLLEEGYERDVATSYADNGSRSKNDQCRHGRYMYEDCEACAAIAIRRGSE